MRNEYKRSDIFLCSNQAHAKFGKRVSAYHVLKVKNCYPNGCVYFYWRCKKLNKGEPCPRGYKHVGRKCFGCKEFYDVKITNHLRVAVSEGEWERFQQDLAEFEDWLQEVRGKTLSINGRIDAVKPHLIRNGLGERGLRLRGFILTFRESFIGRVHFEDFSYADVPVALQRRYRFSPGDRLEFLATVELDNGRIVFRRLRRIEFEEHTPNSEWSPTETVVSLSTATELPVQLEKCHYCPHGVLVDVKRGDQQQNQARRLYCLKGIRDPVACAIPALDRLNADGCPLEE